MSRRPGNVTAVGGGVEPCAVASSSGLFPPMARVRIAVALRAAFSLAAALSLAACLGGERHAGGDDFPNSVETLGKAAAAEQGEGAGEDNWNAYGDAPATPPDVYDSTQVPDAPPEDGSGSSLKSAAPALGAGISAQEGRVPPGLEIAGAARNVSRAVVAPGLNRAVRVQVLTGITARDTTWYRTDTTPPFGAARLVRVAGVVSYTALGRTERFSFEDADGDGVLSGRAAAKGLARARFVIERAGGRIEERDLTIDAGPDGLFATRADNALRALEVVQRQGDDTLDHLVLRPVAPDTVVFAPGRASNRVEATHRVALPGVRLTRHYRSRVFSDSSRNVALRYRRVVETAAGVREVEARGRDSLPDFAPGDTGIVTVRFVSTATADTLERIEVVHRVRLADSAAGHAGNRLLRLERVKTFRLGPVAARRWRLQPPAPVAPGAPARAGAVDVRIDWRGGGWVGFAGDATDSSLVGTWLDSRGDGGSVRFDAAGRIVTGAAP